MDDPPRRPEDDDPPPSIADAAGLFDDDRRDRGAPRPAPDPEPAVAAGGAYDLAGPEEPPPDRSGPPTPPAPPGPAARREPSATPRPSRPAADPEPAVEQVWSRGAEWGPNLAVVVAAAAAVLLVFSLSVSAEQYGLAFFVLVFGGVVVVLLSYPMLITLERPVRVTPEQAARDFYGALSHHVPHYRRMWLLLSREGRLCSSYGSFEGFRNYWKGRLAELKGGRASPSTPLKFVVEDFKSEKSAGQTALRATFTVKVLVRGRQEAGPIESIRVQTTLARGPDRMWYLDRGTLP